MNNIDSNILSVRKRGIWKEKEIYFTISTFIFFICSIVGYVMSRDLYKTFHIPEIVLIIGCLSFVTALAANIVVNKRKNRLLIMGEVIWAKIDKKASWIMVNEAKIVCSYFKDDRLWLFETKYSETDVGIKTPKDFYSMDVMPVIVNQENYHEYIILFEEMLLNARKGINRPLYFTPIVRKIDLSEAYKCDKI